MLKLISGGRELGRFHALTAKKKFFAHLAEDQADDKGGHGENRRAVQDRSQNPGEFRIGHWIRSHRIDRTGKRFVVQHVENRAYDIPHRDPGPPLASVAQPTAQTQAKRSKHFRQGAAIRAHHDSNAHLRSANSRLGRGL